MEMTERAEASARDVGSEVENKMGKAADTVKQYAGQAKNLAVEYGTKARDYSHQTIREYPFWSVLVAFGFGLGLGALAGVAAAYATSE